MIFEFQNELLRRDFKNEKRQWQVCITSYEMITMELSYLKSVDWVYVIIDEGQRIKNEHSLLAKNVRRLKSSYRLLLTGTPLQNNLHELWALLNYLLPDLFGSSEVSNLRLKHGNMKYTHYVKMLLIILRILIPGSIRTTVWEIRPLFIVYIKFFNRFFFGVSNPTLRRACFQRKSWRSTWKWHKSNGNGMILPKLTLLGRKVCSRHFRQFLNDNKRNISINRYRKVLLGDIELLRSNGTVSKANLSNLLMQLRKACNHPYLFPGAEVGPPFTTDQHVVDSCGKLLVLDKLLVKLKAEGSRVLLFSQFTSLLDILQDYCIWKEYLVNTKCTILFYWTTLDQTNFEFSSSAACSIGWSDQPWWSRGANPNV